MAIGYHFTASPTAVFGLLLNLSKLPTIYQHITDPSVCPLHTSSPIPQRPMYSGPRGHRPPGQRRPRAARRTVGGRRRLEGCVPPGRGLGFARATSISPRTNVTPLILHPAALQWSEWTERASFQQTELSYQQPLNRLGGDLRLKALQLPRPFHTHNIWSNAVQLYSTAIPNW